MGTQKKMEIRFTEEMKGYQQAVADGQLIGGSAPLASHPPRQVAEAGATKAAHSGEGDGPTMQPRVPARFVVTVTVPDLHMLLSDPGTTCILTGKFYGRYTSGQEWSAPILDGVFHLFAGDTTTGPARMEYHFSCVDPTRGTTITLDGYKDIARRSPFHVWRDTTKLFCEWRNAGGKRGLVSTGVLRIYPLAFLKQLTTFRTSAESLPESAMALFRFFALFARVVWNIYGPRLPGSSTSRKADTQAASGNGGGTRT